MSDVVSFTRMADGTRDDYMLLQRLEHQFAAGLPGRIMDQLARLKDSLAGYQVTRLEHSLIAATLAEQDGADDDWIAAALVHDIGDDLAPFNHDSLAAAILKPYVREQCSWVIQHHGIFQMVFYAHHYDEDPEARQKYADSPYFQDAADFCEFWDQEAFDPAFEYKPLEHFEPVLTRVFTREAWDAAVIRPGAREPLRAAG